MNSLGERFRVTSFGESHGRCIGVVVDGCPAGLPLSQRDIQMELDRRRPGLSPLTSRRREPDSVEILSGIFNGHTTGAPIAMLTWNRDVDSRAYEEIRWRPRPGHADYAAHIKYGGFQDHRGGGRFSGRITAGFVMAGAVAKRLLEEALNVEVLAHVVEIGGIKAGITEVEELRRRVRDSPLRCGDPEAARRMEEALQEAVSQGDSLGGKVECLALGLPPGVGDPVFDTLEGDLAKALYAIPGVKAVEFGLGVGFAGARGSQVNDPLIIREGRVELASNNAGGVFGGISVGAPISVRVTFKPTPSIAMDQRTVDLRAMRPVILRVGGRHDPCIALRGAPVVEAMVAIVLADHSLRAGLIPPVLEERGHEL